MNSSTKTIFSLVCFLVLAFLAGPMAFCAPEPALVPASDVWQLDLQLHGQPQQIEVLLPGNEKPKRYWYLLYTVTNNTGDEVEFYPQFTLMTNTFKLTPAGQGVRKPVFDAIQKLYKKTIPLLEPEDRVTGKILKGEDNARDSVAIFEDFDPKATRAAIFITGLSNETVRVEHPSKMDDETGEPKEVMLRKTLMLNYQVPGDKFNPDKRSMLYRNRKWIMR